MMLLGPILMSPAVPCPPLDNVDSILIPQPYASLPSLHMPPAKRPKLSLQTTQLSTNYGTSSSNTGAVTTTMSTTTPTTLNTLSNTFDLTIRPSPISSTSSPAPFQRAGAKSACSSPYSKRRPIYDLNLPFGKRPILKNSSLGQSSLNTLTTSASPRHGGRRSFFPCPKKVSFQPSHEEIVTQTYVARHVDLGESESESSSSDDEYSSTDETSETAIVRITNTSTITQISSPNVMRSPTTGRDGLKRGRSVSGRSPSATRSKRKRRRWEWTLGDLKRAEAETMATVKAEEVIADAEAEVQLQMETEAVEVEEGVEAESADSVTVEMVSQHMERREEPRRDEVLAVLGDDSDWETITSSVLSSPQMVQTRPEALEDPTISDGI